ncbi:MAG TPA: hypothetical protein VMM57_00425 [Bacteroidota bacterium]|nr:hypothetical protein [Bacteroidota bacterium]
MKRSSVSSAVGLAIGVLLLAGCSSNPSKEDLKQLETTKAEIVSLTEKADTLKKEKAELVQANKEAKAKLQTCEDDRSRVSEKLKGLN